MGRLRWLAVMSALALPLSPARANSLEQWIEKRALPREGARALSVAPQVDTLQEDGARTAAFLTRRAAGTRTPIHVHEGGGVTCLIEGEMTLYVEGQEPVRKGPGECYYMPSGVRMFGHNSGKQTAVFFDFFKTAKGQPLWRPTEGGTDAATHSQYGDKH